MKRKLKMTQKPRYSVLFCRPTLSHNQTETGENSAKKQKRKNKRK